MNMNKPRLQLPKLNLASIAAMSRQEQSTHFQTAHIVPSTNDGLSYTFRAVHDKVKKTKIDTNNYIFDLDKTLSLNLEIINNFLPMRNNMKEDHLKRMAERVKTIHTWYEKRKVLKLKKEQIRSKALVDSQIYEEMKRRKDENLNYWDLQKEEWNDAVEKKWTFIKKLQKKFNEVEIYVQRECCNFPKWKKKFCDYEIVPFLFENEHYQSDKIALYQDIKGWDIDIKVILNENIELKKKEEFVSEENVSACDKPEKKWNDLVKWYNAKIKYTSINNEKLKEIYRKITSQVQITKITNNINKKWNENKESNKTLVEIGQMEDRRNDQHQMIDEKYENDSVIMNNNADQSVNNISRIVKKNQPNGWDISCIEHYDE